MEPRRTDDLCLQYLSDEGDYIDTVLVIGKTLSQVSFEPSFDETESKIDMSEINKLTDKDLKAEKKEPETEEKFLNT